MCVCECKIRKQRRLSQKEQIVPNISYPFPIGGAGNSVDYFIAELCLIKRHTWGEAVARIIQNQFAAKGHKFINLPGPGKISAR